MIHISYKLFLSSYIYYLQTILLRVNLNISQDVLNISDTRRRYNMHLRILQNKKRKRRFFRMEGQLFLPEGTMPPLLEEHLAAVYSGCGDDGGHGEHQVAEEPVEVHETPRSRGETFSDEGLLQTVHAAARPEEEMDDQPPNPEASQEETEHQDTQPPRNEETPENTDGGEDEVIDPLKEEVIKPAKVKLLEQFKIEMDRIRLLVKPLVDSLPLDTSQRAEVDRRIERFRSAATIVTGGSTKKPKTTELTEHLLQERSYSRQ